MRESVISISTSKKIKYNYLASCLAVLMGASVSVVVCAAEVSKDDTAAALPVITVYGQQNNTVPESVVTIDRNSLDRTGATDMASVVKYLPLVSAPKALNGGGNVWDGAGTTGYNIRGLDANRVGLDVDGVELASATPEPDGPKSNSYSSGRDFIDPELFSQVSVTSGTTSPKDEGLGGRVTFKTKSPEEYLKNGKQAAGTLKGGYSGADNAWFTSSTLAAGNDVVQGLVAYSHRDGHEVETNGKLEANPSAWKSDAVLAKLIWNITGQQKLGFTFDFYKKHANNILSADVLGGSYPRGGNQNLTGERTRYALDYQLNPENFSLFDQLNANVYYQATKSINFNYLYALSTRGYRSIYNNYTEDNYGLSLNAVKNVSNHKISYGLIANQINSNRPWQEYNPDGSLKATENRMVKSDSNKYAVYVSDAMTWNVAGQPLTLTPGLRYQFEKINPKNTTAVLKSAGTQTQVVKVSNDYYAPSLALDYQIASGYYSYLKYNHGARIPTATEMFSTYYPSRPYAIVGNSSLKKETSDAFELGLKTTPIDGIHFDLTGFYTKYKNFIDYQANAASLDSSLFFTYQLQNVANVNIWGGELSFRADLGKFVPQADGISLALVAGKSRGVSKNTKGVKGGVNSVQPEKASLTFGYDDPAQQYGLGLTSTVVGAKKASKDSSVVTSRSTYTNVPGYAVYDLSAYWNANKYMTFNVALNNMFDKKYWDYASTGTLTSASLIDRSTLPGRNVVASVEFKF